MKKYLGKIWKCPEHRSICPYKIGVCHPSSTWIHSQTQKLLEPHLLEVFIEVSACRPDGLLTRSPATLYLWRLGWGAGRAESSKHLIKGWSFWQPATTLKLSRGLPRIASLEQKIPPRKVLLSPRKLQGI